MPNQGRAPGRQERALTCPWPHPRPTQVNRDTHSSALSTLMAPDGIRPRPRSPAAAARSRSATSERPQPRPPALPRAPPRPAPPPRRQAPPRARDRALSGLQVRHLGSGQRSGARPAARGQSVPTLRFRSHLALSRAGGQGASSGDLRIVPRLEVALPHAVLQERSRRFPWAGRNPAVCAGKGQPLHILWTWSGGILKGPVLLVAVTRETCPGADKETWMSS